MDYTLGNKCPKNLCKRIVLLQLIIENVVTCFFGTQCMLNERSIPDFDTAVNKAICVLSSVSVVFCVFYLHVEWKYSFFVTFNLNCRLHVVSVRKPSEQTSNFWTVLFF